MCQEEVLMSDLGNFQKNGEIRLIKWIDIKGLICLLVSDMIPFCVIYDKEFVIVRSIDYCMDDGK